MLIRDYTQMETAMNLTHRELVEKRKQATDAAWQRKDFLQAKARQLVSEYKESLQIGDGDLHIVQVGRGEKYDFNQIRYPELDTSSSHELLFTLRTDLSESVGENYYSDVTIRMWKKGNYLHVGVVSSNSDISIASGEPEGCFHEVIALIKSWIVKNLSDYAPR